MSKDPEVIRLGATVLRMVALSEPFYGVSIVTEGMLQGAGKTSMPFFFNLICMWGVRIGGTLLCIYVLFFHDKKEKGPDIAPDPDKDKETDSSRCFGNFKRR